MNTILLLFFALPIATIILAIVLQKILKNPVLVAATFFAIYLIVTFAVFDSDFLIFAIAYTIIAYITAVLVKFIKKLIDQFNRCNNNMTCQNTNNENSNQTNFTLTSNQTNPVLFLTNRTDGQRRRNCCCSRR